MKLMKYSILQGFDNEMAIISVFISYIQIDEVH